MKTFSQIPEDWDEIMPEPGKVDIYRRDLSIKPDRFLVSEWSFGHSSAQIRGSTDKMDHGRIVKPAMERIFFNTFQKTGNLPELFIVSRAMDGRLSVVSAFSVDNFKEARRAAELRYGAALTHPYVYDTLKERFHGMPGCMIEPVTDYTHAEKT